MYEALILLHTLSWLAFGQAKYQPRNQGKCNVRNTDDIDRWFQYYDVDN